MNAPNPARKARMTRMILFATEDAARKKGISNMGQRVVRFSDLTNKIIEDDDIVRVVVERHPALLEGPVELEAAVDEVEAIRLSQLNVVSLKVYQGDGSAPETVTMKVEEFDQLSGEADMADVLRRARPAYAPRKQSKPAAPAIDKLDYSSLEHAGKPHRGKTTDAEKEVVRNNLDKINERLERDGMRPIRLDDPEMVTRYGLEALAKDAGHIL
ncbi:MAG TPA: hypothetical protein VFO16_16580 [Pseudonocardiaceae bacterium]|nr:hypothetical protein [Pseudonocardiaceae bacterium]